MITKANYKRGTCSITPKKRRIGSTRYIIMSSIGLEMINLTFKKYPVASEYPTHSGWNLSTPFVFLFDEQADIERVENHLVQLEHIPRLR